MQPRSTDRIQNIHFRTTTVFLTLKRLDTSKATDPDGTSAHVLKACASHLALPLSRLFSLCFRSGIQPSNWVVANVVPIHKKKFRSAPSNYRPIFSLAILSKVMETIVHRSFTKFLGRDRIPSPRQFGFHSGVSLLTKLHHEWSKSLAIGGAVHVLAIAIASAFDKVSHLGVLHKAKFSGMSGPTPHLVPKLPTEQANQGSRWWPIVSTPPHQSRCPTGENPRPYIVFIVRKRLPRHSPARLRTGHIRG